MNRNSSSLLLRLVIAGVGCSGALYARGNKPSEHAAYTDQAFLTVLVTACKLSQTSREMKYASDLNTLANLNPGAILVYVLDVGSDGPSSQKIGRETVYYNAFNLYLVGKIDSAATQVRPSKIKSPADNISRAYKSPNGELFKVEWRASVTFNKENGRGGYLEGQGGLLSTAEYDDIITYLQTQPFRLVKDWKSILSKDHRLPACNIKWTATDRYISTQAQ